MIYLSSRVLIPVLSVIFLLGGQASNAQSANELRGKDLTAQLCNSCHVLAQRIGGGYTPQGWATVMRMMTNHGLNLDAEQLASITQHLVTAYPQKPRPAGVVIAGPAHISIKAWSVPTPGSRPHDPLATADGALWYSGQLANVLGRLDPQTGAFIEYLLKTPHTGPHGLMEDKAGNIWFTGNTVAMIGKLDPASGVVTEYPMPDKTVTDPHTLVFDQAGILWFTAQVSNRIGRLDPKTGEIKLLTPPTPNSRPYGMAVNSKGTVFYVAFGVNKIGAIDPVSLAVREYTLPNAASRPRRITITSDDIVWYADFSRGYLGRLDPVNGQVSEWLSPSGPRSQPYGMSAIQDVIWYSESGTNPGTVVRFDPKTQVFQSWAIPGGGDIVRNTSVTPDGGFVLANSLTNEISLVTPLR